MNYFIQYFYGLSGISIIQNSDSYTFKYGGNLYNFSLLKRTPDELYEIIKLSLQYDNIDRVIKNREGNYITTIYGKKYILTKKIAQAYDRSFLKHVLKSKYVINYNKYLDRSNWVSLWENKIDNIEYQLEHIINKFPLVCKSINYYIGLAENGIMYIRHINIYDNKTKVVSHIRVLSSNINDPQNIIIDNEGRDICEYLKYIFFVRKEKYKDLAKQVFQMRIYNEVTMMYIYGRMFFLTYFFDLYDKIINGASLERKIIDINNRTDEYEDYIKYIYGLIINVKKIPNIDWV